MTSSQFNALVFDCLHIWLKTEKPYDFNYAAGVYNTIIPNLANFITAQSMLETSAFASSVFKRNNNCFGMKVPHVRKTKYIDKPGSSAPKSEGSTPYAHYATVMNSIYDLLNWFQFNGVDYTKLITLEAYVNFIGSKGFFGIPTSQYLKRCQAYMRYVKPNQHA
ncbi:MAG: hypothetical protein JWQ09_1128 [Segetibacter sp.]|nr:hypothetical protein [Segetibacter sp.]